MTGEVKEGTETGEEEEWGTEVKVMDGAIERIALPSPVKRREEKRRGGVVGVEAAQVSSLFLRLLSQKRTPQNVSGCTGVPTSQKRNHTSLADTYCSSKKTLHRLRALCSAHDSCSRNKRYNNLVFIKHLNSQRGRLLPFVLEPVIDADQKS